MKKTRVLVAKPGLDGHDRGAKIIVHLLREAGMEIIYTGLHQTADQIVNAALEEDVDIIGLSILSGAHLTICKDLLKKMAGAGIKDKPVLVGGVIPEEDILKLKTIGIKEIFPTASKFDDIVKFIKSLV